MTTTTPPTMLGFSTVRRRICAALTQHCDTMEACNGGWGMDRDKAVLVGDYLKQQRTATGLSTRQLAVRAGLNKSGTTVSRIEAGEFTNPKAETLVAIAEVLDISVTDLFTRAGYITRQDLPGVGPYLRAMFDGVPHDVLAALETHITDTTGPHLTAEGDPA